MIKHFVLLFLFISLFVVHYSIGDSYDDVYEDEEDLINNERFMKTVRSYLKPKIEKPFHNRVIIEETARRQQLPVPPIFDDQYLNLMCRRCRLVAETLLRLFRRGRPMDVIKNIAISICVEAGIYPEKVCRGAIELNLPILQYILEHRRKIRAKQFCEIVDQENCLKSSPTTRDSSLSFLYNKVRRSRLRQPPPYNGKPLQIIHITDIHYDPQYVVGSNAKCENPLCCREDSGTAKSTETESGVWGDYRACDIPAIAIDNALQHIKKQYPDADMVIYSGDSVAHNVWETTFDQIKHSIDLVTDRIRKNFGSIPVYNILGNHESQPVNQFAPVEVNDTPFNSTWLYEFVADKWKEWLPKYALDTLRRHGYYYVDHSKNLKIISLNSNVCYTFNWWLQYDNEFFNEQLDFVWQQLLDAESKGMYAYIISHVPPGGSDCYIKWQIRYQQIKTRFPHIIQAEFVGHTHLDEIRLTYDLSERRNPIGVVYNGGSLTPFEFVNPNYRVYYADPDTLQILDYDNWVYNLTKANQSPDGPEWYLLYRFKDAYNLKSAHPKELNDFIDGLAHNSTLFNQYKRFQVKNSSFAPLQECNEDQCKHKTLCDIVTSVYKDERICSAALNHIQFWPSKMIPSRETTENSFKNRIMTFLSNIMNWVLAFID